MKTKTDNRRCSLCDEWYSEINDKIHSHPEPQSGEPRTAWIKSNLPYDEWIEKTEEGRQWANWKQGKAKA